MTEKTDNLPAQQSTGSQVQAAPAMDPMQIWNSIAEMATNPDVDATKIGALLDYQERIMDRAAREAFTLAKNTAMANMPKINKDSRIEHNGKLIGKYKKYEDLRRAIDPVLTPLGLRITHETGFSEHMKMPTVTAVLSFVKGGMAWTERGGEMVIPFDATGAKSGAQGAGSSLTYGQRYTTCAMLGIVIDNEDDDGRGGQKQITMGVDEQKLWDDGMSHAARGTEAYAAWFKTLTNVQRGWLVDTGKHDSLKTSAAEHN